MLITRSIQRTGVNNIALKVSVRVEVEILERLHVVYEILPENIFAHKDKFHGKMQWFDI